MGYAKPQFSSPGFLTISLFLSRSLVCHATLSVREGKRCVTSQRTAAKKTRSSLALKHKDKHRHGSSKYFFEKAGGRGGGSKVPESRFQC